MRVRVSRCMERRGCNGSSSDEEGDETILRAVAEPGIRMSGVAGRKGLFGPALRLYSCYSTVWQWRY